MGSASLYVGLFDDCNIYYRNQFQFDKDNEDSLRNSIKKAIECVEKNMIHYNSLRDLNENVVLCSLQDHSFIKWCRVEKYYCIVISINGVRPYIYSKDCDVTLVDWNNVKYDYEQNDGDEMIYTDGAAEKKKPGDNVNENPVIALMKALQ